MDLLFLHQYVVTHRLKFVLSPTPLWNKSVTSRDEQCHYLHLPDCPIWSSIPPGPPLSARLRSQPDKPR